MTDDVSEVKSRLDIVDVISGYVKLKRQGNSFMGLCPFHGEKTPSFSVSQDKQMYYCFGCHAGGDVIQFVKIMEGLSFHDALASLAERAGVTLSARGESMKSGASARDARSALEEARKFFCASLAGAGGEAARAYLARRNLGADAVSAFGLGWSPQSWDALSKHLESLGFGESAFDAGLAARGDRGAYDRFRGRVMFPVNDDNGRVVAFGGRLIDGEGAKYVNSPEGPTFNKRKTLYLMDRAKKTIRERGRAILVEGYMDAIRAHMAGFTETVASLGTALTEEQAALIKRFAGLCYISYDADGAGQSASIRGMYILQRHGVDVRVVTLPQGLDPDDLLSREEGAAEFEAAIGQALPLPVYHVHIKRKELRSPGQARAAREEILSGLASIDDWMSLEAHLPSVARGFGILEHELKGELAARRKEIARGAKYASGKNSANLEEGIAPPSDVYINDGVNTAERRALELECAFCSLLWYDEELRSRWDCGELLGFFLDEATRGVASALLSGDTPGELEERWRSLGETVCLERLVRGDAIVASTGLKSGHAEKLVEDIRGFAMRRRYDHLKPLVIRGDASPEQMREFRGLAAKLKGRR
jgi:DNA primase